MKWSNKEEMTENEKIIKRIFPRTYDERLKYEIDLISKCMNQKAKAIFKDLDNLPDVEEEEPSGCDFSGLVVFDVKDYQALKRKYLNNNITNKTGAKP